MIGNTRIGRRHVGMTLPQHATLSGELKAIRRKLSAVTNLLGDSHLAREVDASLRAERALHILLVRLDDAMHRDLPAPRSPEEADALSRCYLGPVGESRGAPALLTTDPAGPVQAAPRRARAPDDRSHRPGAGCPEARPRS
jgi:hypothetical protein